jgi:hypothetical protein
MITRNLGEIKPIDDGSGMMQVTIHIACDSLEEILTHLSVIRGEVRKVIKKDAQGLVQNGKQPVLMEDSNCYGCHTVIIK